MLSMADQTAGPIGLKFCVAYNTHRVKGQKKKISNFFLTLFFPRAKRAQQMTCSRSKAFGLFTL